jgi:uncharacterized protein
MEMPTPSSTHDAGDFDDWLASVLASFHGRGGMDVPCGSCRACCRASYFIHIRHDEGRTLAAVPPAWLVSAPGGRSGDKVIGISPDGSCPLLSRDNCSIYPARPQTCRDYDCRIFAAAGLAAGGAEKAAINQRVAAWRFRYTSEHGRRAHDAIRAAAHFLQTRRASFPGGRGPVAAPDIAVLAIKVHRVFLDENLRSRPPTEIARAVVRESQAFDELPGGA